MKTIVFRKDDRVRLNAKGKRNRIRRDTNSRGTVLAATGNGTLQIIWDGTKTKAYVHAMFVEHAGLPGPK